ncbi:hypothetical protein CBR_g40605 [Chara braunii]|uniref:Reverse transcriptase domain-containing protein n=1 Tax=Chara braunii TaxID=69332 RepID=A0A388LU01_CHABU|nr:hypothetical protein CBR_g40605 [Chara braunii]|eukprot:GBG85796.1 hypothetical protein CBR_g40605 [Chara braunii]
MRDPGNRLSALAPVKTRRVGEEGTSEPTREEDDGEVDRMWKETFWRLCPSRSHGIIRALLHSFNAQTDLAEDTETMAVYATTYYSDILTSRRAPDESLEQLRTEQDLWQFTDKQLAMEQRHSLDRPVTIEELKEGAGCMAKGKAPGDDGLPVEFFLATWEVVGPILVRLFNRVLEEEMLTEDMCRGVITLLYKKGDKRNVRNWRPISLLNVAYKILAKALSRRLAPLLPELVNADQGAFVKGRSITENMLAAMGALEIIGGERRQVVVAMLDLEKAYDRVNWSFVLATLEHMNFGIPFRRWIAIVLANGRRSPIFNLSRSLRQGCLLAPMLFVLQIEVALNDMRAASMLRGLKLQDNKEFLTGAIADDLLLVAEATPESMNAAKSVLDQYSRLSEAKVNWDKSLYFLPQEYELENDWMMKRIQPEEAERSGIERGVSRVADLWAEPELEWKSEEALQQSLGRIHRVGERLQFLIQAIPGAWKHKLLVGAKLEEGVWYKRSVNQGRLDEVYKVEAEEDSDSDLVEEEEAKWVTVSRWKVKEGYGGEQALTRVSEMEINSNTDLMEIRVLPKSDGGGKKGMVTVQGGAALQDLRIDPGSCVWQEHSAVKKNLVQYNTKLGRTLKHSSASVITEVGQRTTRELHLLTPMSVIELKSLWSQLFILPSLKLSGLLWLLSHSAVPTAKWLSARGMEIQITGRRCGNRNEETLFHLTWECPASNRIWRWWSVHWQKLGSALQWDQNWVLTGRLPPLFFKSKGWGYMAQAIRSAVMWVIWEDRNNILFRREWTSDQGIKAKIKAIIRTMIVADCVRKADNGRSQKGKQWFLFTWARGSQLAAVTVEGKMVLSPWLSASQMQNVSPFFL